MKPTTIDCAKTRAKFYLNYGIDLDETTIGVTYIIISEVKQLFTEQDRKLGQAIDKIDQSQKTLEVDNRHPRWQAFWYGMGKWGAGLILAVGFSVLFYCVHLSNNQRIENLKYEVTWCRSYIGILKNGSEKEQADFLKKYPVPKEK